MPAKKTTAIARLVPSIEVRQSDGSVITVPISPEDNSTANKVLASQMRDMIQVTIKKYKDDGNTLTPKELKELTSAARDIAEFSGEVYKSGDILHEGGKSVDGIAVTIDQPVDFSAITSDQKQSSSEEVSQETTSGKDTEGVLPG